MRWRFFEEGPEMFQIIATKSMQCICSNAMKLRRSSTKSGIMALLHLRMIFMD